jgi:glycosyltransferase involved in cell wall biosynthesis
LTILHVISGLGTGGAEATLLQVTSALQAKGMPQHVVSVTDRGRYADELEARGVAVTALGVKSVVGGLRAARRLARMIEQFQPHVVQGWMYHGDLMALFAHALARGRAGRRLYWNLRASNMDRGRYGWLMRLNAFLSNWPDLVIANSKAGAAYHLGLGYRPRRLEVIVNGIDTEKFRPDPEARKAVRAELDIPADAVVAIHVARVDPMKDHATFLAAMRTIPQVQAILVGSGTDQLTMPSNVRELGLRSDTAHLYAAADMVVSTSAFGEGFSNAIGEGLSAGLVPIATDSGDVRIIIGDTGAVVATGDAVALASRIVAEATVPPEQRHAHGLAARARIEQEFPLSRAVEAFARLYGAAI